MAREANNRHSNCPGVRGRAHVIAHRMERTAGVKKRADDRVFRERGVRAAGFARVDAEVDFVAIIYGSLRGGGEVEHTTAGAQEQLQHRLCRASTRSPTIRKLAFSRGQRARINSPIPAANAAPYQLAAPQP